MRFRVLKLSLFIAFFAIIFCGCAPRAKITTGGDTYDVTEVRFANSIDGRTPTSGNTFLLITLKGDAGDITDIERSFFNYDKSSAMVSDGSLSAQAKSAAYMNAGSGLTVTLVFEVPPSFSQTFSLYGDSFNTVELKAKKA